MKHRTFIWFILPSALAMVIFIAMPIASVLVQSVYAPHEQVVREVENCSIFGCTKATQVDQAATQALRDAEPLGRFVGTGIYADRNHLALSDVGAIWQRSESLGAFARQVLNLPLYGALAFTLTYTLLVTPLSILLGFVVALGVNAMPRILRGGLIFVSLLPMIVTPLVGALILFWMVDARGILGSAIQALVGDPSLSVKASTPLMWAMLIVYGVWSSAPFAFVVYYAGLQTVPQDTLESAMIDGASRWERIRYVIVPHLLPLTTFMALIKIMDNFRVFEPIVSFNAAAHAQSLSYFIYSDLGGETRLLSSAAATSVLTIAGVVILLSPSPSGCGKTTTMRMIAGLEDASDGDIVIGGRRVNDLEPKDRDIAMVFQSYGLYPTMTVYENIRFPLKVRKIPAAEHNDRVMKAASVVELGDLLDRKPAALSGGQRQRVALARAIVRKPKVFLMDEPLSNLDAKLRVSTRAQIKNLHHELKTTTIYVTHDQIEAMTLADRVVVMSKGEVQQVGTPLEIYDRPANTFVAAFIGNPAMNLMQGEIRSGVFEGRNVRIPGFAGVADGPVTLGFRAEDAVVANEGEIAAPIYSMELLGDSSMATVQAGGALVAIKAAKDFSAEIGAPLAARVPASICHLFDARTGSRIERTNT